MSAPNALSIRMYDVGFGDCFLLTFHYSTRNRSLLIDFGTTRQSQDYMKLIAADIRQQCSGKLDAVVATHRHRDHISGFATDGNAGGESSGQIIADLNPSLVSMTWTEDPDLDAAAIHPVIDGERLSFIHSLKSMSKLAQTASAAARTPAAKRARVSSELTDLSEINISNKSALTNLLNMSGQGNIEFLHAGSKSKLNSLFRGVRFHVLGPPTVEQSSKVKRQASKVSQEYWHFANYWKLLEDTAEQWQDPRPPFTRKHITSVPSSSRWLVERMANQNPAELLRISRVMDAAINNTSVILVLEIWGTKLLFPGDAQWESWDYVLNGKDGNGNRKLLADVDIYKVGHHGSLNGTPKSLWRSFTKKGGSTCNDRLISLLSTRNFVHGKSKRGTEVPRTKLLTELTKYSDLISTDFDTKRKLKILEFSDLFVEFQ